jgi:predicted alpha-1,6-mannanase (GH76 family)
MRISWLRLAVFWPTVFLFAASVPAQKLKFTPLEVNPVVFYLQSDHYCGADPDGLVVRGKAEYIGQVAAVAVKEPSLRLVHKKGGNASIAGMWADNIALCDPAKQQIAFYDSVWRDPIRFEALVNYQQVFGADLKGKVSLAPYAVDDGVVSAAMTKMLTTDTTDTLGAQYDDIMWWALAFLRAYAAHPAHQQYLEAARLVFSRVHHTPDQAVCGGGVIWGDGTNYKNAITNSLYLVLSARLAGLSEKATPQRALYLKTAVAQADWLLQGSRLFVHGGLLQDGIHYKGDVCQWDKDNDAWTYSQGVAIDGLAQLTVLTGDRRYADGARHLLLRVLDGKQVPALVNEDGILLEPSLAGKPANEDAEMFKGILVRHVGYAIGYFREASLETYGEAVRAASDFLISNANAVWKRRQVTGTRVGFGFQWDKEADGSVDMRTTTSGLNLLNAAWGLQGN